MAIDLAALKAKLAAKKLAESQQEPQPVTVAAVAVTNAVAVDIPVVSSPVVAAAVTATPGAERTISIDHMEFFSKMQELQEAIHTQHPKMPVLLMLIHKQITADPELVSVLSEEEIGTIVNGLKIQTKTELVGTVAKQSKARDKKTKLSADMF